jgi:hypothetical protein
MHKPTPDELYQRLIAYCTQYQIPFEYLLDILNDQKVLPMIRGKGTEYGLFLALNRILPESSWEITKLNLSAQPNQPDQDISITHRRTGIRFIAESKNAARGTGRMGSTRTQVHEPHFKVKCHRSRSNMQRAEIGNDRYSVKDFDILVTTPLNALYKQGTVTEALELLQEPQIIAYLSKLYDVHSATDLITALGKDWRFVFTHQIADEHGLLPRNPIVRFQNDPVWFPMIKSVLNTQLEQVVQERIDLSRKRGRNLR